MRKLIYGGLLLAAVGIGFIGCDKEEVSENTQKQLSNNTSDNNTSEKSESTQRLTAEQIENIGDLHNQYLELAFQDFDYSSDNSTQQLTDKFQDLANSENIDIDFGSVEVDLEANLKLLSKKLSPEAMDIINIAVSESYDIANVTDFEQLISSLESSAKQNLKESDIDATLVTLCVLRKSAFFWLPVENGGSGVGDEILRSVRASQTLKNTKADHPHGWLAADGAAAGGGMIGTAVTASLATGPVGWGFLVGVAVGSGLASGWYALTN